MKQLTALIKISTFQSRIQEEGKSEEDGFDTNLSRAKQSAV